MFLQIDRDKLDDWLVEELEEELADSDCLPKGFWTNSEWYEINMRKRAICDEIKNVLRLDAIYYHSLEFKEDIK